MVKMFENDPDLSGIFVTGRHTTMGIVRAARE
jgi:hypothetical protein